MREFIASCRDTYLAPIADEEDVNQSTDRVELQNSLPPFYIGSYGEALQEAKSSLRFLVIYLHGDSHQDTSTFCL